ncbi:MAG: response regulator, partial [Candidatus Thiodiazotropha sp. (ex Lucinoma aequizonata)]|nr:response regulator [Candidatus Thiodiazotropha sp. (ex Lucinoma aequizonata)]MCU7902136.1 response regulator [Candidatus Thiodiazotropha sp. (ex Lucinoma aequizonata)]
HHEQELPPFRLISRWNQVLRSDSFHIGQGFHFTISRLPDYHLNWHDKNNEMEPLPGSDKADDEQIQSQHTKLAGRVLVVEDNPVNQAILKKMLEKAGLSPITTNDGVEAMDALHEEQFDVVLMDCQMRHLSR